MNTFEYAGNLYQIQDFYFYGHRKSPDSTCRLYPGNNTLVPACMRPALQDAAIKAGIPEDVVYRNSDDDASEISEKPKTRKASSKKKIIRIF